MSIRYMTETISPKIGHVTTYMNAVVITHDEGKNWYLSPAEADRLSEAAIEAQVFLTTPVLRCRSSWTVSVAQFSLSYNHLNGAIELFVNDGVGYARWCFNQKQCHELAWGLKFAALAAKNERCMTKQPGPNEQGAIGAMIDSGDSRCRCQFEAGDSSCPVHPCSDGACCEKFR